MDIAPYRLFVVWLERFHFQVIAGAEIHVFEVQVCTFENMGGAEFVQI